MVCIPAFSVGYSDQQEPSLCHAGINLFQREPWIMQMLKDMPEGHDLELFRGRNILKPGEHLERVSGNRLFSGAQVGLHPHRQIAATFQVTQELARTASNIQHFAIGPVTGDQPMLTVDGTASGPLIELILQASCSVRMGNVVG